MYRSIFLGDEQQIRRVYSQEMIDFLLKDAGLNPTVFSGQSEGEFPNIEYIFSTWGMPTYSKEDIARRFPSLKAVFYAAGSVQSFALPFLENGVKVFSAWAANAVPVAEYTTGQIILANKGYFQAERAFRATKSKKEARERIKGCPGNYGCKVGIIGAGMIGSLVCERLKAFNLKVLVFDPFLSQERAEQLGVELSSLERVFGECQTVSNHLANNRQTVGMINGALLSLMRPYATFINTGRGAQVVEDDLIRVLAERKDLTAVLDVTFPEPPTPDSGLYSLDNVFLTPHIAGSSGEEVQRMAAFMLEEYVSFSSNKQTRYEITAKMLETMA
ncbi:MAG: hydroxyacid dehydrogenase [Clostridiales bacterium]|nr:hydroxyacid dehydrogenase [Clostridiales bacterium]